MAFYFVPNFFDQKGYYFTSIRPGLTNVESCYQAMQGIMLIQWGVFSTIGRERNLRKSLCKGRSSAHHSHLPTVNRITILNFLSRAKKITLHCFADFLIIDEFFDKIRW